MKHCLLQANEGNVLFPANKLVSFRLARLSIAAKSHVHLPNQTKSWQSFTTKD